MQEDFKNKMYSELDCDYSYFDSLTLRATDISDAETNPSNSPHEGTFESGKSSRSFLGQKWGYKKDSYDFDFNMIHP